MQNPLVVSSDELRQQRAIVLDGGRRVNGAQDGDASRYLELDERRLRGAAVDEAVGVAIQSLDAEMIDWPE